jgi:predicted hydrocarbon binding protein
MQTFAQLPEEHRLPALKAFSKSVARHGADSLRLYQRQEPLDRTAFLERVARTAGALGWGQWILELSAGGALSLQVRDSPFAAGYGPSDAPVCFPIVGMFGAVAESVLGKPCIVEEAQCSAAGSEACRFAVVR